MQQEIGFVQIFGCKIDYFSGSGRFTFSLAEDATRSLGRNLQNTIGSINMAHQPNYGERPG